MDVVEIVAKALAKSDGGSLYSLARNAQDAYRRDAKVAVDTYKACLLGTEAEEAMDKLRSYDGDPNMTATNGALLREAVRALETDPGSAAPLSLRGLIPGLTNESAAVLWAEGHESDGKDDSGPHDPRNMRRALAWLLRREMGRLGY